MIEQAQPALWIFSVCQQQQQGLITAVPFYNIMLLFNCDTQISDNTHLPLPSVLNTALK